MPLTDKKIISIILEEGKAVEERCDGYRDEIIHTIADIIAAERGHRVEATNIQKRINDKCDAVARFFFENRHGGSGEVEA